MCPFFSIQVPALLRGNGMPLSKCLLLLHLQFISSFSQLLKKFCINIFGIISYKALHLYVMFSSIDVVEAYYTENRHGNQTLFYQTTNIQYYIQFYSQKSFTSYHNKFPNQIKRDIQTETGMLCTNVSVGSRTFVSFFLSFGIPRITIQCWPPSTTRILL